ncbi:MAG TPA: protein kinase [Candidatus Binatia bacterium]|jgi:WD40 repeat protein/serine/threonine protein kinase|nr:protein kinase [Candidatus Binatia bacterium]
MSEPPHPEVVILNAALELDPAQRVAYLDQACAGDAPLREQVQTLLRAHTQAGNFLEDLPSGLDFNETIRPESPLTEQPGDKIGRYKLLQKIGEGGCGVVYMAEQEEPVKRRVALKIIKLGMDTNSVIARFEAERQALALMDHPNIAKVLDVGATGAGRPFFVMELVRGVKVTDYCDQSRLSTRARLELFVPICRAIQHAHQKGIIHRDIKPSNILVTVNDGVPVPKVIDFGIAKATLGRLTDRTLFTAFEQFIGTPAYMSPEQAVMTSLDIDTRSDIYSLGVLLYELLTGTTPFNAQEMLQSGLDAMRRTILHQEPMRPSTRLGTLVGPALVTVAHQQGTDPPKLLHLVRGDLDWVVMKCLEKDRARRYETANGLAMDIERHLQDEPIFARPPSKLYRFQKLVRRNKVAFTAVSAVAAALLIGFAGVFWQWQRAERHASAESSLRLLAGDQTLKVRLNLYAADVSLASQALQRGDYGLARRTLAALAPNVGEPDLRGFEWRYLWNLCQGDQLATLTGHQWIVTCTAFSQDGKLLATGSQDGTARIWEPAQRRLVETLPASGHGAVWSVAFSPNADLLMIGGHREVQLWDTRTWRVVTNFPGQLAVLSKSGSLMAVADSSPFWFEPAGKVTLWDYRTGELLKQFDQPGRKLALSPDGRRLAVADAKTGVTLRDVNTGQLLRTLPTDNSVWSLEFSPDGSRLATAGWSSEALVWNLATQRPPEKLQGHYLTVWSAGFSPDGATIVTTGTDQTIRLWDTATLHLKSILRGHGSEVWCACFSPDGALLASGGKDRNVMLWSGKPPAARGEVRNADRTCPTFSPDGKCIAATMITGSRFHSSVWNAEDHTLIVDFPDDNVIGFSPDGTRVISWDAGEAGLKMTAIKDHAGARVALGGIGANTGPFYPWGFSPGQETFFAIDRAGLVRFWEAGSGRLLGSWQGPVPPIHSATLGPGGRHLAISLEREKVVRLYERATGHEMQLAGHHDFACGLAISPDGATLASGSVDGTIRLWMVATGKELAVLPGHMQEATDVAFSPDGRTLASVSQKESVKLWNLDTQRELLSLDFPQAGWFLQFSPDGRHLAVATTGNSLRFLDAPAPASMEAQRESASR